MMTVKDKTKVRIQGIPCPAVTRIRGQLSGSHLCLTGLGNPQEEGPHVKQQPQELTVGTEL
jgi:hypothetical protein